MSSLTFISYSSQDKVIANAICARLEGQGIRCWIAPRDIDPGSDYSDQIAEGLEKSAVMVLVFSSGSNRSRHVKSEIDRAFSLGQVIVPFRVEDIEPEKGLAYYLSKTHWLDAVTPPLEQHIDHLAATIRKVAGEDAVPVLPPPPLPAPVSSRGNPWPLVIAGGVILMMLAAGLGFWFLRMALVSHAGGRKPKTTIATTAAPLPTPPQRDAFEGAWRIAEAQRLDGETYGGTMQINQVRGRYAVAWKTGTSDYSGFGLADGNLLCAGWGAKSFGVILYRVGGDGTLQGTWMVVGADAEKSDGTETAVGGPRGRIEGNYTVQGSNPGGEGRYQGTLEIARTGTTYRLQWNVAGQVNTGVGVKVGDHLCVAWGSEGASAGVAAYRVEGRNITAVWTQVGETRIGTENLVKQ